MTSDVRLALGVEQLFSPVPGGIGRYVEALCTHLPPLMSHPIVGYAARGDGELPESAASIRLLRSRLPRAALYESWHRLRRPLIGAEVDVIHAPSLALPPAGNAALVVTIHDLAFEAEPQHHTRWGLRFHRRGLALADRDARLVIVPSSAVESDLVERHPSFAGRVRVVHHGVKPPSPDIELAKEMRKRFGLEAPYVLWVGTLEPRKNLPRIIQAFGLVARNGSDLTLALVGPKGWKEQDPEAIANRCGVADRVKVLGTVRQDELDLLYSQCEVFVYPSLQEGFGFPVIEAMAAGAPVVTSDRSSLPEAAGGAALLVDPTRTLAIAEGIAEVIDNPAKAARLRGAGLERARLLTWERSARAHVEVYEEAAG